MFISRALLAVGILLSLPFAIAAQNFPHDPALIDKIEKGDFMHIRDDNNGRMDLLAVLLGASRSHCDIVSTDGFFSLPKYIKYLGSDSVTGKYPSGEFEVMGLLSAFVSMGDDTSPGSASKESNFDGPWLLDPNAQAAIAIGSHGCNDPRFKRFAANILKAIDHHANWHDQKLGDRAPLMTQTQTPVLQNTWREQVMNEVELHKYKQVMKQIAELEAAGTTYLNCVYGPTNPDSTGTDPVTFWYKQVPTPGGEFLKVSRKNPLATFGDTALSTCPATLPEARQKRSESQRLAQSKVDSSVLPPFPVPMQLMLGAWYPTYQNVRKSWIDYESSHNPKDQQTAIDGKEKLLRTYNQSCKSMQKTQGGDTSEFCQLDRQLIAEFQDIPEGPPSSASSNRQVASSQPSSNPRMVQPPTPAPGGPPATAASGTFPAGTQLMVSLTDTVDLTAAGQTFHGQLLRAAQYGDQVSAPQGSEVELLVSAPETSARGNIASVSLTVVSVTFDGKRIAVSTQPVMRRISTGGRSAGVNQIASKNMLVFTVRAPR